MSPFEQAILLGMVHGLTAFLPISSDGHLALARVLLELEDGGLTLTILLHYGTLLAALIYFRQRIAIASLDCWKHLRRGRLPGPVVPGWDVVVVLFASIPTGLIGLALRETVAYWSLEPLATGFGFVITACLLTSALWARPGTLSAPSISGALLLGVAQGVAVAPGVSRSAITIVVALWLGLRAERAFELSMLLGIPAVAAALALELLGAPALGQYALLVAIAGIISLPLGLLGLGLSRRVVSAGNVAWFALWVLPLALATLALAKAWPG